jgi:hypothetical protein
VTFAGGIRGAGDARTGGAGDARTAAGAKCPSVPAAAAIWVSVVADGMRRLTAAGKVADVNCRGGRGNEMTIQFS